MGALHTSLSAPRLVEGPPDARGDDGGTVVRGHFLVCGIERDLALPQVRPDAGLEIVGHNHGCGAVEELKGVHMAVRPDILLHVECRLEVAVPAEGAHHERVDLGHLAAHGVHERHHGPRPVGLHVSSGLVPHAADDAAPDGELTVTLVEAVVGHRGLARGSGRLGILRVQDLERHVCLRELPAHAVPVGIGVDGNGRCFIRDRPPVDLGVRYLLRVAPCQAMSPSPR